MRSTRLPLGALLAALVIALAPFESATAQGGELARFIAMYRSGNAEPAVAGLLALSRIAETVEQRAVVEYHLGLALLRTRPAEAGAALRRSISIDPDLRPDVASTGSERKAWEDVRAQMSVPTSIRFLPATTIPGTGDSIGMIVDVSAVSGGIRPRVRVLLALPQGRDPVELWAGIAGERGAWDGTFRGDLPQQGTYPLIVEVFDESGVAPLRWRRSLELSTQPLPQPLMLSPRPVMVSGAVSIRVKDDDRKKGVRRRGIAWAVGGTLVAFAASRMVSNAIDIAAPNGGPRIALATMYGLGLASAVYGTTRVTLSATRRYETTVTVPNDAVLRRQRFAESMWQADSARVTSLNARRDSLRRVTVQVQERR